MDALGTGFDALLTRGALVALLLAAGWALTVVVAVAVEARTRGRVRLAERAGCPRAVRLWLLGLFTAILAGVAPAHANDLGTGPGSGSGPGPVAAIDAALDGLPLPDRPTDGRARTRGTATPRTVVVRPGDSLWRIAHDRLPRARDAEVAAAVAALYAANRPVIGPDPDRVEPGQHLVFPDPPIHPEEP